MSGTKTTLIMIIAASVLLTSCAAAISNAAANEAAGSPESQTRAVTPPVTVATPEPVVQINKDPAMLTHSFYEYYLDGFPSVDEFRVIYAKYLTPRFLGEALKADDYDPFLDAQDFDETWKDNNYSVKGTTVNGEKATVAVFLNGKTMKWNLKVSLLRKNGVWKIDGVKNLE